VSTHIWSGFLRSRSQTLDNQKQTISVQGDHPNFLTACNWGIRVRGPQFASDEYGAARTNWALYLPNNAY